MRTYALWCALVGLGFGWLAAACVRSEGPPEKPRQVIELRGADGGLQFVVEFFSARIDWKQVGGVSSARGTLHTEAGVTLGVDGTSPASALRPMPGGGLQAEDANGLRWSLVRQDGFLRMGDSAGFPRARVHREGEVATLHAAGGEALGVARIDGGRVVLSDREGKTVGFVTGALDIERAVLVLEPGLEPFERAMILAAPKLP